MKVLFFYTFVYVLGLVGFFPLLGQTTYYVLESGVFNASSRVASGTLMSCPSGVTACNNTPLILLGTFNTNDSIQICCNADVTISNSSTFQAFANITIESGASLTTVHNLAISDHLTVAGDLTVNRGGAHNGQVNVSNGLTVQTGGTLTLNGGTLRADNTLDNSGTIDFRINLSREPEINFFSDLNGITFNLGTIMGVGNAKILISGGGAYTLGFPGVSLGRMDILRIRCTNCTVNQNFPLQTKNFQMTSRATNAVYNAGTSQSLDISEDIILVNGRFDLNNSTITTGSNMTSVNFDPSGGTFNAGSGTITVNGNFAPSGGTFNAGSATITVNGDFFRTSMINTFNHQTSTVRINTSGNNRTIITGNQTLHNLQIINSGSTDGRLSCLAFPNQTININERFKLMGTSMGRLTFTHGGGSTQCMVNLMKLQNMNDFSFSTIRGIDSNASAAGVTPVIFNERAASLNITDGGNNRGWFGVAYTAPSDHIHSGLNTDTTYYYILTASASDGSRTSSPSNEVSAQTASSSLSPPSDLRAFIAGDTQITLSWTTEAGIIYDLYWSTTPGVNTGTGTRISRGTRISSVSPPYTHTGLNSDTTYYYIVTASDGLQTSSPSNEVSVKTPPSLPRYSLGDIKVGPTIYRPSVGDSGINFMKLPKNTRVEVKNIKGSRIYSFTTSRNGDHRWNVRTDQGFLLGSGVYIVYFSHQNKVHQIKFIVIR